MTDTGNPSRGNWTGSTAFVLVAAGSAIGLGNIWKFPFITGMNGGGAFVLVYLLCIAIIGLPILAAEMLIGRKGGRGPVTTFATLASKERGGKAWSVFGWMAVITAFILLSYYSVVGGWTIAYAVKTVSGAFSADVVEEIPGMFDAFVTNSTQVVLYHLLFMTVTILVVIGGVQGGIERAAKILMPALGVLLLILLGRSLVSDGAGKALTFMFYPDFSKLTPAGILEAMGHAFFTLSLGMGAILVYGSYLKKEERIFKAALAVGILDTVIALVAGVMIFGIVFSSDLEPAAG
ncbi:MAG: sodium-dependent transporter, partial [Myxococcota bacterium]